MKFFTIFTACMLMVLSVFGLEDLTKQSCPNTGVTFEQCINQYGGYNPTETTCASKANLGEEYNRCLALAYYNLLQCFGHCPSHPSKATYEQYFQQYQPYYTAVTAVEVPTATTDFGTNGATNTDPLTGATTTGSLDLDVDTNSGSTMLNAFSLGAVLCMVAYWLF